MNKLALVVVLGGFAVGCKKKEEPRATPPPPPAVDAAPAIDATDVDALPPPLTPAIPDGKIGLQIIGLPYDGAEATGLPAIRDDGSQIAVRTIADDGGRGYLDLHLKLLDRTGKVTKDHVLADADEITRAGEASEQEELPAAFLDATRAKVAEANALFATGWHPMKTARRNPDDASAEGPVTITVEGHAFTYDQGKLTVKPPAGAPIVKTFAQLTGIKSLKKGSKAADEYCGADQEFLAGASVDVASKTAVAEFGFLSGHNCGNDGEAYGVIALP